MKKKEKEIRLLAKYGTYKYYLIRKKLHNKTTLHKRRERKKIKSNRHFALR